MQLSCVHSSHDFESRPCREICEAYGLCHVSNYLGRIPKSRCCTNYKVVVYRIGQTSPVPSTPSPISSPLAPPFPHSPSPIPRPPIPRPPIPRSPIPPFPHSPFQVLKIAGFSLFHVFRQRRRSFILSIFNLQTLKTSLQLVFYSYSTRMYSYVFVFYSYVTRMYSYVNRMYSYVTRMYLCVTRMYSYVLVCYSYVTRMYSCGVLVTIYLLVLNLQV